MLAKNQLKQKSWTFLACLGIRLASALLKRQKKYNNKMVEVNVWGDGRMDRDHVHDP